MCVGMYVFTFIRAHIHTYTTQIQKDLVSMGSPDSGALTTAFASKTKRRLSLLPVKLDGQRELYLDRLAILLARLEAQLLGAAEGLFVARPGSSGSSRRRLPRTRRSRRSPQRRSATGMRQAGLSVEAMRVERNRRAGCFFEAIRHESVRLRSPSHRLPDSQAPRLTPACARTRP